MYRPITYIFYALTILIPLIFTTINYELFEFPKFIILLAGTLFILVLWIFDAYKNKDWTLPSSPLNIPILAFLASQTLSTIFSIDPYTSFWGYYSRFHQGLLVTISYTILYFAFLKYMNKKSIQSLFKISIATATAVAIYAILQRLGIDKNIWQQDVVNRPFSTLGQPNWMAAYILPNIFLALYYFKKNPHIHNILYYSTMFILYTTLIISKSRSGYLAFSVGFTIYWLSRLLKTKKWKPKLKLTANHIAIIILSALIFGTVWTNPASTYLQQPNTPVVPQPSVVQQGTQLDTGGTESGDIRKIVWTGAWKLFLRRPILGTGVETFAYSYYWERPVDHNYVSEWDFLYNKAHNEYLNLAATTGILGLVTNLSIYLLFIIYTWKNWKKNNKLNDHTHLAIAISTGLVTIVITNFFGFSVIPVTYLVYILIASAFVYNKPSENSLDKPNNVSYIIGAIALLIPYRIFVADYNFAIGRRYFQAGQIAESIPYLEKATKTRTTEPLFYSTYAEALSQLAITSPGTDSNQLELINRAVQAANKTTSNEYSLNFIKSRAKVYLTLAQIQPDYNLRAHEELKRSRELAPTDPKLAYNLGLLFSRIGDNNQAIENMKQAIELKINYESPYYALTLLYEETGQRDLIPDLLQQAVDNLRSIPSQLQGKINTYL